MALIPNNFGISVLVFGALSFFIGVQNSIQLLRPHEGASSLVRRLTVTVLNLLAYIVQRYLAVQLIVNPHDSAPVYSLTTLLLVVYILAIFRAWELLGGTRNTPIKMLTSIHQQETSSSDGGGNATAVPE